MEVSHMGGSGSGHYYRSSKCTTEGLRYLDVNWMKRQGMLSPARSSTVHWSSNGKEIGRISVRAEENSVALDYKWRSLGDDWEEVSETVRLTTTRCNYGGCRPWFVCPNCFGRVGKLYSAGKYFLCRHCYNLVYETQREALHYRLLRKTQSIRKRLGGSESTADEFPPKPKGMHWKTYNRLRQEAEEAEEGSWGAIARFIGISFR